MNLGKLNLITTRPRADNDTSYVIFLIKSGGAIYLTDTNEQSITQDINKATRFKESRCLASNISRLNVSDNCYSSSPVDKPQWYSRDLWGTAVVQSQVGQMFPDRFKEDASFNVVNDTIAVGFWASQPLVSTDSNYYYAYYGRRIKTNVIENPSVGLPDNALFFSLRVKQPSTFTSLHNKLY